MALDFTSQSPTQSSDKEDVSENRRAFLRLSAGLAVGSACCLLPLGEAEASDAPKEVDLSAIKEGECKTILWRGKPVFIRHRTPQEIDEMRKVPLSSLKDPQKDEERVAQSVFNGKALPEWIVTMGSCSHLGCVPRVEKKDNHHEWFCSCHGSRFDASGRVLNGPAEKNLAIPPYRFVEALRMVIG